MDLKNWFRALLVKLQLLPSQYLWPNPFKIIEFDALLQGVRFKKDDVVLDFGCGSGRQTILISKKVKEITGIDISQDDITKAKKLAVLYAPSGNIEFRSTELEAAGFKEGQFDKIISFCVLEHIPNYIEILRGMHRVLKDKGMLLMSVDALETITDPEIRQRHTREGGVAQYFTPRGIRNVLEKLGFEEVEVYPIFKSPLAQRMFEKGILDRWNGYSGIKKFVNYWKLFIDESRSRGKDKGIFLCVKAVKKESKP